MIGLGQSTGRKKATQSESSVKISSAPAFGFTLTDEAVRDTAVDRLEFLFPEKSRCCTLCKEMVLNLLSMAAVKIVSRDVARESRAKGATDEMFRIYVVASPARCDPCKLSRAINCVLPGRAARGARRRALVYGYDSA